MSNSPDHPEGDASVPKKKRTRTTEIALERIQEGEMTPDDVSAVAEFVARHVVKSMNQESKAAKQSSEGGNESGSAEKAEPPSDQTSNTGPSGSSK